MEKMMNKLMKRYKMVAGLGFLLVVVAFLFSLQGAGAQATFFSVDTLAREAAEAGSVLALANVARHSIPVWVPALKFLGLGLLLGGITMALGLIVQTLRDLGMGLMSRWPAQMRPGEILKPRAAKIFPMLMMMGWLLLMIGLVWAFSLNGTVQAYWNHSVAAQLNPAQPGSLLLGQLAQITAALPWLNALRFAGMALLFTAITLAVTVIIRTLQMQEQSLGRFIQMRTAATGD